jgi:hypothetical protein
MRLRFYKAWHRTRRLPVGVVKFNPLIVGGSSNGRTADSGSVRRGSNPLPPA